MYPQTNCNVNVKQHVNPIILVVMHLASYTSNKLS